MRKQLTLILLLISAGMWGQVPSGYYDAADGLTGENLKAALHDIIDGHTVLSYTPGLWMAYEYTDRKADGTIWDMYSDVPDGTSSYTYTYSTNQCGSAGYSGEGDCYNREHSFPKSWFNEGSPMVSDIFHIVPTDGYVNGKRSNYPYGEVDNPTWTSTNGCKLGPCVTDGYSGTVFEPIDEYKGDFARAYFYMATRYYGEDDSWSGSGMVDGAEPKDWALTMLKRWHEADPVSDKETERNDVIYEDWQHNRNPFIDHPEYVDSVWNGEVADTTGTTEPSDTVDSEESVGLNLTFDDDLDGCTVVQVSGATAWGQATYKERSYAAINTYGKGINESWLVTPAVDMDAIDNEVFDFEVTSYASNQTVAATGDGQFALYYSSSFDGTTIDVNDWTRITSVDDLMLGSAQWVWVDGQADVTGITGEAVYFAFVHRSDATNGTTWEVDNVSLTGETSASLAQAEKTVINVYPNPATQSFSISAAVNDLEVMTLSGRVLMSYPAVEANCLLDISTWSSGFYLLRYDAGQGVQTSTLLKP